MWLRFGILIYCMQNKTLWELQRTEVKKARNLNNLLVSSTTRLVKNELEGSLYRSLTVHCILYRRRGVSTMPALTRSVWRVRPFCRGVRAESRTTTVRQFQFPARVSGPQPDVRPRERVSARVVVTVGVCFLRYERRAQSLHDGALRIGGDPEITLYLHHGHAWNRSQSYNVCIAIYRKRKSDSFAPWISVRLTRSSDSGVEKIHKFGPNVRTKSVRVRLLITLNDNSTCAEFNV